MKNNKLSALIALLLLVSASVFSLSACNTISGMGEDMEAAGDAIDDEAEEKKTY